MFPSDNGRYHKCTHVLLYPYLIFCMDDILSRQVWIGHCEMDQNRKRRLNNRKTGLSHCKVARVEEPGEVPGSRDVTDTTGSCRHVNTIRSSSPQSDSASKTCPKHCEKPTWAVVLSIIWAPIVPKCWLGYQIQPRCAFQLWWKE